VAESDRETVRRRPRKRAVALALLFLLLLALFILWTQRMPIASDYIRRELERRGVEARYEVTRIGLRTERLDNLIIGDPGRPDLTARWAEVRLAWTWRGPKVVLITARGVRLNARVVNGKVTMGQVDKLLPKPTGAPFRFPDQVVDVADASIRLDTPAGRIGLGVEGRGNLADGFRGKLAAASGGLNLAGCRLESPRGYWDVSIDSARPSFHGPLQAPFIGCGDTLALRQPLLNLEASLDEGLDGWRGKTGLRAAELRVGKDSLTRVAGNLSFDGSLAGTRGGLDLGAAGASFAGFSAGRTAVSGAYDLALKTRRFSFRGDAKSAGISGGRAIFAPAIAALASAGGTPLEPIGDALSAALRRATERFDASAALSVDSGPGGGGLRLSRVSAVSGSGARLALGRGDGVSYAWPSGLSRVDGDFALSGGGFPDIRLSLAQPRPGGPISGVGRVAPMRAGAARLALAPIRFSAGEGGVTRIGTVATIDGPIPDGRVQGLVLPISGRLDGRGGFAFGESCVAARFAALSTGSLRLGPTRLPLCPTGRALLWKAPGGSVAGGAELRSPRFTGRLGKSPVAIAASRLRFDIRGRGFTASDVAIALGSGGATNRLSFVSLAGRFAGPGVTGTYSGLAGKLATVFLAVSEGKGAWQLRRGVLDMDGSLVVTDTAEPTRINPLRSDDFRLRLADSKLVAQGTLVDPDTGTKVLLADIAHNLTTGAGRAKLDVPGITFDDTYQPEQLTRLTTGVIALVRGTVRGEGEIRWDDRGSSSTGTFSTEGMNFAAAFGPVEGFSSTVHFTDLLGLVSAPGQLAEIAVVRTGIDVFDGKVRYQLLPDLHVRVEGGEWPFAGGRLALEETVLDFSQETAKHLTFRVTGLDAAAFVQQMEFSNISATGTFDGIIPMIFDKSGGRIVGGHLIARPEGGTLSYIGELTDKDLGVYGKLAFDALKALRYSKLNIGLDGALDGEFVAGIELDGIARDPGLTQVTGGGIRGIVARRALAQLAKIPFEFNITVRGPFRTLIATARSLEDPTNLIQATLPDLIRGQTTSVQPQESEKMP
jgi:translocation and assembly module TamB